MIRKIVGVKEPSLRQKSKTVNKFDKKIKELITDLKDTLEAQKDPIGVGLAAPQIGKNFRMFAIKPKGKIKIIVNPVVVSKETNTPSKIKKSKGSKKSKTASNKILEGCLSLPNYYGPLTRSQKITVSYLDENGKSVTETFEDLAAQIIEHEIDHLEGILFIDRLIEQKKVLYELINGEWERVELV